MTLLHMRLGLPSPSRPPLTLEATKAATFYLLYNSRGIQDVEHYNNVLRNYSHHYPEQPFSIPISTVAMRAGSDTDWPPCRLELYRQHGAFVTHDRVLFSTEVAERIIDFTKSQLDRICSVRQQLRHGESIDVSSLGVDPVLPRVTAQ